MLWAFRTHTLTHTPLEGYTRDCGTRSESALQVHMTPGYHQPFFLFFWLFWRLLCKFCWLWRERVHVCRVLGSEHGAESENFCALPVVTRGDGLAICSLLARTWNNPVEFRQARTIHKASFSWPKRLIPPLKVAAPPLPRPRPPRPPPPRGCWNRGHSIG